jgi:hypothetical protein
MSLEAGKSATAIPHRIGYSESEPASFVVPEK